MKTHYRKIAKVEHRLVFNFNAKGMTGIVNDLQPIFIGDLLYYMHLAGVAVDMHGEDRPCLGCNQLLNAAWVYGASARFKKGSGWEPLAFAEAEALIREKAARAAGRGPGRVRMVTEVAGESLMALFGACLERWRSRELLVFEPFAYESLKAANRRIFGVDGLPSYRIEDADLLLGLGADFLETWLSPVEYARKFKEMHRYANGAKGCFCHVGPYQSLTAANADEWLPCWPGGEAHVALALVGAALSAGRGRELPPDLLASARAASGAYTPEKISESAGIDPQAFARLSGRLLAAGRPLVLGTGSGASGPNATQANTAANLLNLILDPSLERIDFGRRHRVELAASRARAQTFFGDLKKAGEVLLLNNVNPIFSLPAAGGVRAALGRDTLFVVSFSNFMDDTSALADLVVPVRMPLENWDEYAGKTGVVSLLQPAMGTLTQADSIGDLLLKAAFDSPRPAADYKAWLLESLQARGRAAGPQDWVNALRIGGFFDPAIEPAPPAVRLPATVEPLFGQVADPIHPDAQRLIVVASPSIRFFDGRGANRPWLAEIPDPLTQVAWQTPVLVHPRTLAEKGIDPGDWVTVATAEGRVSAPAYDTEGVVPGILLLPIGQGHAGYGRYAQGTGANPLQILFADTDPLCGGPLFAAGLAAIAPAGRGERLAHMDGSRVQHGRKIALSVALAEAGTPPPRVPGLGMWDFPLTLPIAEGYDPQRDIYPPHGHDGYRWAMVVDLDRCIGCGACAAACYAENNIGVVGVQRVIQGREMAWLQVQRYLDPEDARRVIFLPMMCQHCDNAPCEPVCPVYAPHHGREGLNNQIYNRCIGTRFCAQNCPYKVRRFNWFDWAWPDPLPLQLNPNVTVRSKGVMEKCSFCIQRIKDAHGIAKNENRRIRDGEIQPACLQTCPTGALVFGDIQDKKSRVRQMTQDPRAYQVMGYLNTKPAVIYLKKVVQEA